MRNGEKRSTARVEVNAVATVKLLGQSAAGNGKPMPVRIFDASPKGLGLHAPEAIAPGQAVMVELGETMFLGEVCYCATQEAGYGIGISIEQCLTGLARLQHLIHSFQPEPREVPQQR